MAKRKTRIELARELGDEFRINQNLNEVFDEAAAARLGVNATACGASTSSSDSAA